MEADRYAIFTNKYIIHAVGPVWKGGIFGEKRILYSVYREALNLAKEKGIETNYRVVGETICMMRCAASDDAPLGAEWKSEIEEDYKKRGRKRSTLF